MSAKIRKRGARWATTFYPRPGHRVWISGESRREVEDKLAQAILDAKKVRYDSETVGSFATDGCATTPDPKNPPASTTRNGSPSSPATSTTATCPTSQGRGQGVGAGEPVVVEGRASDVLRRRPRQPRGRQPVPRHAARRHEPRPARPGRPHPRRSRRPRRAGQHVARGVGRPGLPPPHPRRRLHRHATRRAVRPAVGRHRLRRPTPSTSSASTTSRCGS
jgi:hypothetical protein